MGVLEVEWSRALGLVCEVALSCGSRWVKLIGVGDQRKAPTNKGGAFSDTLVNDSH